MSHPDIRVKNCAYGHSVATLLTPGVVATVSHKYSLTVARHATVVAAVPSTVHYPANYKLNWQIVRTHQHNTSSTLFHTATNIQRYLQSDTKQIKTTIDRKLKDRWEAKRLHGQFPQSLDEGLISKEQSYRWIKFGDIKGETEIRHNGGSGPGN
jgi:hypothetical protein